MIKPLDLDRLLGMLDRIARRRRVETENRRLMEDLGRAKGEWESTFDSISDPIAVVDSAGRLVRVNRALCERFGVAPKRATGILAGVLLFGGCSRPRARSSDRSTPAIPLVEEREDLTIPGVFEVARHPVDLGDEPRQHLHPARRRPSARRRSGEREELIARSRSQNAELERYAYTVSHDLKSPLITITGFLGLVERAAREGDEEGLKAAIARIDDGRQSR